MHLISIFFESAILRLISFGCTIFKGVSPQSIQIQEQEAVNYGTDFPSAEDKLEKLSQSQSTIKPVFQR